MSGTREIPTSRRELSSSFFPLQGKAPKKIQAILTETLACFLPGRTKDFFNYIYIHIYLFTRHAPLQKSNYMLHCTFV